MEMLQSQIAEGHTFNVCSQELGLPLNQLLQFLILICF